MSHKITTEEIDLILYSIKKVDYVDSDIVVSVTETSNKKIVFRIYQINRVPSLILFEKDKEKNKLDYCMENLNLIINIYNSLE